LADSNPFRIPSGARAAAPGKLAPRVEENADIHASIPAGFGSAGTPSSREFPGFHTPAHAPSLDAAAWRQLADSLPFGIIVLGPRQELRHENAVCQQLLGSSVSERGGIEPWLSSLCPDPEQQEDVISSWREHIWRNQVTRTFTLRSTDQKIHEVEFRSSLQADGGITLTVTDVTHLKRCEETLRHWRPRFHALFSQVRTPAVLVDRSGRITNVNPAGLALLDTTIRDLRLTTVPGLLHPQDGEAVAELEAVQFATPTPERSEATERRVWVRTAEREIEVLLRFIPGGEIGELPAHGLYLLETIETAQDAEAHSLVKQRLEKITQKTEALLEVIPDLLLLVDGERNVVNVALPRDIWIDPAPSLSWRGRRLAEVWPELDAAVLSGRHHRQEAITLSPRHSSGTSHLVLASSCGQQEQLILIRALPKSRQGEQHQHELRNRLQLVTSLFSLESSAADSQDAFLRWQIRLRNIAHTIPERSGGRIGVVDLLRHTADDICSLMGRGPGRRLVTIRGNEGISLSASTASLCGLFFAEVMRLQLNPHPESGENTLLIDLRAESPGKICFDVYPTGRPSTDSGRNPNNGEILELLGQQMQARLEAVPHATAAGAWRLILPTEAS
jgi:PAS domain-containing protein/two-component sensor histidine kinase